MKFRTLPNIRTLSVLLTENAYIECVCNITGKDRGCRDDAMGFEVPAEFFLSNLTYLGVSDLT